jgi:hypothetical protein
MNKIIVTTLMVCALSGGVKAHELQENRATLVLRDRQHVSLAFFVDYVNVLHQTLAPQRPLQDFVLMYSAMQPEVLKPHLQDAQRKLQGGISLTLTTGKKATLTHWIWPNHERVQKVLQAHAMEAVVASAGLAHKHAHAGADDNDDQVKVRAEAKSSNADDFTSVTLQLPPQFQNVLVVSYQPKQVWVKPGKPSPVIRF